MTNASNAIRGFTPDSNPKKANTKMGNKIDLALLHKLMSLLFPIFVLPLLGLLSGVKPRLTLLALVIPYSGNTKVRYDSVFSLGPFDINKSPFRYPFWVAARGKASLEIACIIHFVLMNPNEQLGNVFILGPLKHK